MTALSLKQTENVTVEDIEAQEKRLAQMKANIELEELQTKGLASFKESVGNAGTIEEAYRLSTNFKWKFEKIKRVLSPPAPDNKKGRPRKH